jgi:hypothetical protein
MGLMLSAIFWYFGADVWHSILLGGAVTSIIVAASACRALEMTRELRGTAWRSSRQTSLRGSRRDVTFLSSSMSEGWGRVGYMAESRVRNLARQQLALHHLDLEGPGDRLEVEQLIGRRAYRLLARDGRRRRRRMRLRSLVHCLDVLDALDPMHNQLSHDKHQHRPAIVASRPSRASER